MNYNHHMSYVQHEQNQEQMHNDIMKETQTLYTNYCNHCKQNNITPKSFNEWMHTEPTQTSNDDLPF